MRRKEREVIDRNEILEILRRCETVRIGIALGEYPYVVPVSFGLSTEKDIPKIYFLCARQGLKLDLLEENPRVCVEGEIFLQDRKNRSWNNNEV